MAISNSLFSELAQNSVLLLSLHGIRTVLERELGIKNILISGDETIKADISRLAQQKGEEIGFPYAYMSLSELLGVRDQGNNKHAQRMGIRMGSSGATLATARKAYLFPMNLSMELKYIDDDPYRTIVMAETMVLLSLAGGLTFDIKLDEALEFEVRIEIPDSIPVPIANSTNTESPGAMEVTLTLVIHTYSGFFRNVAAVQKDRASINMEIKLENETIQMEV